MNERRPSPELDDTVDASRLAPRTGPHSTGARPVGASLPPNMSAEQLAGRYEIVSLLGSGGMGTVYRARDLELDEVVALKVLREELANDAAMLARFRQEVKLARRVTHPNVARTYDIGEHGTHRFLTMELVDGVSLADALVSGLPLPTSRILDIARALCAGLTAAHAAGVVHRDLKPENVLLGTDGRVLITDFGIARLSDSAGGANRTQGGAVGTPAYMAPEQVEAAKDIDARADIYALGAIFFELWTGRRAWDGDSAFAVAARRLIEPPPDPRTVRPDVPESVAHVVLKCMARARESRFQNAADVASALEHLSTDAHVVVVPAPTPSPVGPRKTVAVLPFENLGAPSDSYLSDGLTDDLIDQLSMTEGVRVCARGVVAANGLVGSDVRALGQGLGVQVVVQGSLRRAQGRLRVTARALSVDDGFQLWAKRFDDDESAFFGLSDRVARAVAEGLSVAAPNAPRAAPIDPVALDLYLRARREYYKFWAENTLLAIELYERALERAPDDPAILAGYAMALARRTGFEDAVDKHVDDADRAVRRALEVALHLPAVRVAKAQQEIVRGDVLLAASQLRDVLSSAPDHVDALDLSGRLLSETGAIDEGLRRVARVAELEPSCASGRYEIARIEALRGNVAASEAAFGVDPEQRGLTTIYWLNRCRVARWQNDTTRALLWRSELAARGHVYGPVLIMLDAILGKAPPDAFAQLVEVAATRVSPLRRRRAFFCIVAAEFSASLGQDESAMVAMENADLAGTVDLTWFDFCPSVNRFRDSPRFITVRERVAQRARRVREAFGVA